MSVLGTNLQVVVTFYWFCNHFLILYSSTWFYFAGRMVVWGKHGEPRSWHICWHLFIMYHQDSVIHVWYICDKFLISLFHFLDLRNIHVLIFLFLFCHLWISLLYGVVEIPCTGLKFTISIIFCYFTDCFLSLLLFPETSIF